jgi:hypothetical protein
MGFLALPQKRLNTTKFTKEYIVMEKLPLNITGFEIKVKCKLLHLW